MDENKHIPKYCICCGITITNEFLSETMCSDCQCLYTSVKRLVNPHEKKDVYRIKTILIGLDDTIKESYLSFWGSVTKLTYNAMGLSFMAFDYEIPANKQIAHFQLWNLRLSIWAPRLSVKSFSPYISGARVGIVLFDMTKPETLDELEKWIDLFQKKCSCTPSLLLVGYNYDKINSKKFDERLEKTTSAFIQRIGIDLYLKIYAFSQDSTYRIFDKILQLMLDDQ